MVPCPRCGEPLDLDQGWCLPCREKSRIWLRAFLKLAGLTAVVLVVIGLWKREAVATAWTDFLAQVELARNPRWKGVAEIAPAAAPAAAPTAPGAPPSSIPIAASTFVYIAGLTDSPVESAAPSPGLHFPPALPANTDSIGVATPPPEPVPSGLDTRRFYGVVYDALTLKPVSGAQLTFKMRGDPGGWTATTNDHGHYQADLFTSTIDKISVSVKAPPGYREGLIEDKDPPLRERALSARRKIVEETTPDELEPIPLHVRGDPRIVALDLVLLPEAAKR